MSSTRRSLLNSHDQDQPLSRRMPLGAHIATESYRLTGCHSTRMMIPPNVVIEPHERSSFNGLTNGTIRGCVPNHLPGRNEPRDENDAATVIALRTAAPAAVPDPDLVRIRAVHRHPVQDVLDTIVTGRRKAIVIQLTSERLSVRDHPVQAPDEASIPHIDGISWPYST